MPDDLIARVKSLVDYRRAVNRGPISTQGIADLDALVARIEAAVEVCDEVLTDELVPSAPLARHIRSILTGEREP